MLEISLMESEITLRVCLGFLIILKVMKLSKGVPHMIWNERREMVYENIVRSVIEQFRSLTLNWQKGL